MAHAYIRTCMYICMQETYLYESRVCVCSYSFPFQNRLEESRIFGVEVETKPSPQLSTDESPVFVRKINLDVTSTIKVRMYVHSYAFVRTYICIYTVRTHIRTYICMYIRTYVRTYINQYTKSQGALIRSSSLYQNFTITSYTPG